MLYLVSQMAVVLALAAALFFALGCWYAAGRARARAATAEPAVGERPPAAGDGVELAAARRGLEECEARVANLEADLARARAQHGAAPGGAAVGATQAGGEEDPELGLVYAVRPGAADDLTAIRGIGKVVARQLNDLGVYTFAQIAAWDRARTDAFAARLSCKDRIRRDDWVGQARRLL